MIKYKILLFLVVLGLAGSFISCDDDTTGGLTGITYYPVITLEGEQSMIVGLNEPFVDPGYSADLNGEDITGDVVVDSNVDVTKAGLYTIRYSAVNEDGFERAVVRDIYVADLTPSPIETGYHAVLEGTHRIYDGSKRTDYSGYDILFLQTEPGVFYVSDLMAGYYDQRVGYGSNYAMNGYIRLNDDNTIELISSSVPGWGDEADYMADGVFNPATGQISWTISYVGGLIIFNVILD
ncbi:BT_2262 family domain-containing protein [Carboxylicivirga taeanensis]|uniref:BT_2262 family domain-containing protein n=1 Tax=Carboxylicivirga taeanensis TaxID=1416875 RepID=UPI003F6E10A5